MRSKEQVAEEFAKQFIDLLDENSNYEAQASLIGFLAGYAAAIEKVKEYLFNTEEHQNKDGKFYISEEYLKQTIKFLNDEN